MNNYQKVRATVLNKTRLVTPKSKEDANVIIRTLLDLFLFESKVQKEHLLESITIFTSSPEAVKEHCASILWNYKYAFIRRDYFSTLLEALDVFLNPSQIEWVKFYFAASDYQSDDLRENIDINFEDYYYHLEYLLPSFQAVPSIVDSKIDYDMRQKLKKMEIAINSVNINNKNIIKWARLFKENYFIWKYDDKYRKYISSVLDIHVRTIGRHIHSNYLNIMSLRCQFQKNTTGTMIELLNSNLSFTKDDYVEIFNRKEHNSIYLPQSLMYLGAGIIDLDEVKENIHLIDEGNHTMGERIKEDIYLREATDWARRNGYNVD